LPILFAVLKNRIITALVGALIVALLIVAWYFIYSNRNTVTRSFYYWKNNFNLTEGEIATLDSMKVNKVYFKLMDIDWDATNKAHPLVKPMVVGMERMKDKTLVPVIFITNRTMQNITAVDVKPLAQKIWAQIQEQVLAHYEIEEIQLDCDWNETTRDIYFNLLTELKTVSATNISATIRLYQYKYPEKAGVPPVNRGMLMFYNMGSFKETGAANSIFDSATAQQYINSAAKYPLPLDIALPSFGWCVLYRNNTFLALIDELDKGSIEALSYVTATQQNIYRVNADTVLERSQNFEDIYLRNGDILKLEEMDAATIAQAAQLSKKAANNNKFSVSFFDFDTQTINYITPAVYENAFNSYK
jgi:hypothetical protein